MAIATPTMDDMAFFHRWLGVIQQAHPDVPETLLEAFCASEGALTAETLALACALSRDEAAGWCRYLAVHLISPGSYAPVFAAEDAVSARRMQHQHAQEDVQATRRRLAELQTQIEGTLAYSHLGAQQAAEVKDKLEALDCERVDLLRHQGDLPGVGQLIEQALAEARSALDAAQEQLRQAQVAHLQNVEDGWLRDALALVEPLRRHLHEAAVLDQAWQRLGVTPSGEVGSGRLRETVQAALRRAGTGAL